ncbi:MAG: hypothetical protein WCF07_00985 [Nitrososphaeraceae archaeon]
MVEYPASSQPNKRSLESMMTDLRDSLNSRIAAANYVKNLVLDIVLFYSPLQFLNLY